MEQKVIVAFEWDSLSYLFGGLPKNDHMIILAFCLCPKHHREHGRTPWPRLVALPNCYVCWPCARLSECTEMSVW